MNSDRPPNRAGAPDPHEPRAPGDPHEPGDLRAGLPRPPAPAPKAVLPLAPLAGRYRPFSPRQRLRLLVGTIVFVIALWLLLIYQPGRKPPRHYPPPPDVAQCKPGQTTNCVGAPAQVRLLPSASGPPASAPAR